MRSIFLFASVSAMLYQLSTVCISPERQLRLFFQTLTSVSSAGNNLRLNFKPADTIREEDAFTCILRTEPEAHPLEDWNKFLTGSLELDSVSVDTIPAGRHTVIVQFVVDEKGKINNTETVYDPGYGLALRVINVLNNYKGRWEPSMQGGRPVKSYRKQPVTFVIEEEEDECKEIKPGEPVL
jgi:hypothetical protein